MLTKGYSNFIVLSGLMCRITIEGIKSIAMVSTNVPILSSRILIISRFIGTVDR